MPTIPYTSDINLNNNQICDVRLQMLSSAPSDLEAKIYYDTTLHKFGYYNGTKWVYDTEITYATVVAALGFTPANSAITVNGKPLSANVTLTASDVGALPSSTTINDLTTTAQQNALNSGATSTNIGQIATNTSNISTINGKIPSAASTSNQLADKQYVDNAVQTNSAHFRGNWATWAAVPTSATSYPADDDGNKTPTVNDYMVVQDASDYTGETLEGAWQFTYTGTWSTNGKAGWLPRFQINEDPLTPSQQAALDSGITSTLVGQISTNQTNIGTLQTAIVTKAKCFYATNPALTVSGGVCTWSITNSIGSKNVNVQFFRESDGVNIKTYFEVTAATITVKFNSTANISAGAYRAVVTGLEPSS